MNTEQFADIISALQKRFGDNLISVVLFGSRARGEGKPESDWDLLIVLKNLPERPMQRNWTVKEALPEQWRGAVSILAKTPEEFTAKLPALYLDIALDGKVLYDRNFIAPRLKALRCLIKRKGLRRVKENGGFFWKWEKYPGQAWSLHWEEVQ